jgi:hypothetical protein
MARVFFCLYLGRVPVSTIASSLEPCSKVDRSYCTINNNNNNSNNTNNCNIRIDVRCADLLHWRYLFQSQYICYKIIQYNK